MSAEPARDHRDAGRWATAAGPLHADSAPRNVEGRMLTGPMQGFGKLWQRTYTLPVGDVVTPEEAIARWRSGFGSYWPGGNRFGGAAGVALAPGDVAGISVAAAPGIAFATGVMVLYADERSFTFMTPQGHMFAGWITFAARSGDGGTVLEIVVLVRPNDPLWELAMPVMGRKEDAFWAATLANLAADLGAPGRTATRQAVVLDRRYQWRNWRNVWHNAGVRSVLWSLAGPLRGARRPVAGGNQPRVP